MKSLIVDGSLPVEISSSFSEEDTKFLEEMIALSTGDIIVEYDDDVIVVREFVIDDADVAGVCTKYGASMGGSGTERYLIKQRSNLEKKEVVPAKPTVQEAPVSALRFSAQCKPKVQRDWVVPVVATATVAALAFGAYKFFTRD